MLHMKSRRKVYIPSNISSCEFKCDKTNVTKTTLVLSRAGGEGATWFVGPRGEDVETCGLHVDTPCASLRYTASLIHTGDIILLDGALHSNDVTYHECSHNGEVISFSRLPSKIQGIGGKPRLGCYGGEKPYAMIALYGRKPEDHTHLVRLENVVVENMVLKVYDINMSIANCRMNNVSLSTFCTSPKDCRCSKLELSIENTVFAKSRQCGDMVGCEVLGDQHIACQHVSVFIRRSIFLDSKVMVFTVDFGEVIVADSEFTKVQPYETGIGGVNVTFVEGSGILHVSNSTFRGQVHVEPILSAINLEESALRVETWAGSRNTTNASVTIHGSTFTGNERAVSISRPFKHVHISDSTFVSNHAMHAAAALRLALDYHIRVVITNSVFLSNSAGTTTHSNVPERFSIENGQVHLSSDQYKGVIDLVGKGGMSRLFLLGSQGSDCNVLCSYTQNIDRTFPGTAWVQFGGALDQSQKIGGFDTCRSSFLTFLLPELNGFLILIDCPLWFSFPLVDIRLQFLKIYG